MADPTTTSTAVAQQSGASPTASSTKVGGTPPSPNRPTVSLVTQQISDLKQAHDGLLKQAATLEERQGAIQREFAALGSLTRVAPKIKDPRTGQMIDDPDPQNAYYVDAQNNVVDVYSEQERLKAEYTDNAAAIPKLRSQAADIQVQVLDATLKLGEVVRTVATDEDPRTLEALDRAAEKERLALAADQAANAAAETKAAYDAAYEAGFPAGNQAALDQAAKQAANANAAATAAFNTAQATGQEIDNQVAAITLKYADALGAAGVTKATAEAGTAVAGQSSAESKAIADAQAAAGGIGTWTAEGQKQSAAASAALAGKYGAETAGQQITNEQTQAGEAVTRINQLREAIRKGAIRKEAAGDLYFNAVYGGDQFQRSGQASKNALELQRGLIDAGMAVRPDQKYIVGGEPGGVYQQGMQQLGYTYTPVPVQPSGLPAWATAAGVDISPRQGLPAGQPFSDTGDFNPAFASPLAAPTAAAPAWATAPATQPAIVDARGGRFQPAAA